MSSIEFIEDIKENIEDIRYDLNNYIVKDFDKNKLYQLSVKLDQEINRYLKHRLNK